MYIQQPEPLIFYLYVKNMGDLLPRGFRFSHKDKTLLAKLVNSFPAILYKGLDAESLSKKMLAWEDLTRHFNANSTNVHEFTFTPRHLKALWKRMKLQSKKAAAAQKVNGNRLASVSPIPETSRLQATPIIGSDRNPNLEDPPSPYVIPDDPPSPCILPENSQDSTFFPSCTMRMEIGEPIHMLSPSRTSPPSHEFFSPYLCNGQRNKRKRPIKIEMENLLEEHHLRMDCLRLDREVKILKKWKIQQEILSAGFDLPPANFS